MLCGLMIGCGAEPTPIPPKRPAPLPLRPADTDILSIAVDYAINHFTWPSLRDRKCCYILQRQTLRVEHCKEISPFIITPDKQGYLEFKGEREVPSPFRYVCFASMVINDKNGRPKSEADDFFSRNAASSFIPTISTARCIKIIDRYKIESDEYMKQQWDGFGTDGPAELFLIRLTIPGYSEDGRKACMYLEFSPFAPMGDYYGLFFNHSENKWSLAKVDRVPIDF